ncbi:MAG TPA: late competence development ComFB family protein [Spirochaetota bacterium]|nr:late competence development ComFB family protein [Spirochaetota bacterium]HOL57047.1 late competence development ComFB family protein [Spirochaetota bacterium]HPP04652.1 late competence development ComFB family protein [Spirochaetota bacterium]
MPFKDKYEFELLINEMENAVFEELERQLSEDKENKICKCQDCILDMATFALNNLKPAYRSSLTGRLYSQRLYNGEEKKEIERVVKMAIEKISKNPSHQIS